MDLCPYCNEDIGFDQQDFDSPREAFIEHLSDKHEVSFNFDFLYFTWFLYRGPKKSKKSNETQKISSVSVCMKIF